MKLKEIIDNYCEKCEQRTENKTIRQLFDEMYNEIIKCEINIDEDLYADDTEDNFGVPI